MPRVTLYRRDGNIEELMEELENKYDARRGTHYKVEDWPGEQLRKEEGVPALGVHQDLIDEEIHHVGEDTILKSFDAFRVEELEERL